MVLRGSRLFTLRWMRPSGTTDVETMGGTCRQVWGTMYGVRVQLIRDCNKQEVEKTLYAFTTAARFFVPRESKGHPWPPLRQHRKSAMSTGGVIVLVRPCATRQQKSDFEGCDRQFGTVQLVFKMLQLEKMQQTTERTDGRHRGRS